MQATLFTKAELDRELAIMDVVRAYNEEIDWWYDNEVTSKKFSLADPSKAFITAQQKRDFAAWYPVRLSLILRMLVVAALVLTPLRTQEIGNSCSAKESQKGNNLSFYV